MKNAYEMKKHAHLQQSVNHYGTVSMKSFTVFYRLTLSLTYKLYLSFNTFGLIVFYDKLHINCSTQDGIFSLLNWVKLTIQT